MSVQSTAVPWGWETERELINAKRAGNRSIKQMAADLGRTRNAVELKLSELRRRGELPPADTRLSRRTGSGPNRDPLHVIACLGQGGFPALTEHIFPRGVRCLALPLIWPARL